MDIHGFENLTYKDHKIEERLKTSFSLKNRFI